MTITEIDIFNTVFFPDSVPDNRKAHIRTNFLDQLEFYFDLQSYLKHSISLNIKKRIAEKIPIYQASVILYPVNTELKKKLKDFPLLAADSIEQGKVKPITFVSHDLGYFSKVVENNGKSLVYIFSHEKEIVTNFNIKFNDKDEIFTAKDNKSPLEVPFIVNSPTIEVIFL